MRAAFVLLLSLFLMACDGGQKQLSQLLQSENGRILEKGELRAEDLDKAFQLALGLKLIRRSFSEKPSGKMAEKKLEEVRAKVAPLAEQVESEFAKAKDESMRVISPVVQESMRLLELQEKQMARRKSLLQQTSVEQKSCLVRNISKEITNSNEKWFGLRVDRIQKVTGGEVEFESLFAPEPAHFENPEAALKPLGPQHKPHLFFADSVNMDCARADKLAQSYQNVLRRFVAIKSVLRQRENLAKINSPGLL